MSRPAGADRRIILDTDAVVEYADRLRDAAERLGNAGELIRAVDPGPRVFGADAPGALGELGRHLYDRWAAALSAGESQARRQGAQLAGAADRLGKLVAGHVESDQVSALGIREVGSVDAGGPTTPPDESTA